MGGKVAQAICQELPSDKQPNCLEYAQIIFQVVVGYLQASYHEALPQLACAPMCADSTPRGLFVPHRQSDVRGVMECAFCEYAVTQIQEAMEDDAERAAVMNDARAACKKLPESLQAACEQYVDEKGPIIIALVESAEPEKVCETLNACEDTRRPALPAEVVQVSAKLASLLVPALRPAPTGSAILRGPQECELCKVAVMEIHDKLDDPAFQQAVIAYAKRVCDRLGENFATQCTQMVDQYAPLVFSMLEDELKPQEFCEMIHLCEPRRVAA